MGPYLNTFGELESNCIIFMALASQGTEENIFGEPGIIFREQGSIDLPWGPLWGYQAFRLQQFDDT